MIAGEPGQAVERPIQNGPDIVTDGSGTWLVAWASDDTLDGEVRDWDILLSRSFDEGSSWSGPVGCGLDKPKRDPGQPWPRGLRRVGGPLRVQLLLV